MANLRRGGLVATRLLKTLLVCIGLAVASAGGYLGVSQLTGNIHTVEGGVLYRSAQLDRSQLDSVLRSKHIKSVLNLRGAHPGEAWYDDELAVSTALGVKHYDYGISAHHVVTAKRIGEILKIVEAAPKPLLIHCRGGADRAGLVAALYLFVDEGMSAEDSDRQLSILYGHFPYLWSRTGAMDRSFWAFVASSAGPRRLGDAAVASRVR